MSIVAFVLGALAWTLLEYCIHRWMGHDKRTMPNVFATEHVRHHSEGDYFAPTSKKLGAAVAILILVGGPAIVLFGITGGVFTAGLVSCYLGYELLHRLEHLDGGRTAYGRWARRHHFHHHFHNPKANHGVTSPIWDLVFGTFERPAEHIRVPERLKMRWLVDPATGDVRAIHASRYELRVSKKKPKASVKAMQATSDQTAEAA